jgi:hypothetical protein
MGSSLASKYSFNVMRQLKFQAGHGWWCSLSAVSDALSDASLRPVPIQLCTGIIAVAAE